MSNIVGINFVDQPVSPNDYGRTLESIFDDCILQGCAVSYGGTSLTLAAGYIIAGGKQMKVPSALSFSVDQASSGYARLLGTIDLSRTATVSTFDQVELTIEYASTQNGFASLTQEDVNGSGTVYQFVLAIVALGTGGITSIVSSMKTTSTTQYFTATIPASGWTGDSSYASQTITVSGLLATDKPIVDISIADELMNTKLAIIEAWGNVLYMTASDDALKIVASGGIDIDIPIKMVVIRK